MSTVIDPDEPKPEATKTHRTNTDARLAAGFAKLEATLAAKRARALEPSGEEKPLPDVIPEALSAAAKSSMRKPPPGDQQADFFVPTLYDISMKDSRSTMDVAVFRLSKKDKRPNTLVRCEMTDGYVEIQSGAKGMASVWDYDLILMAISHLTEAVNRHKAGKGDMPGRLFRPHVSDILKFCRRSSGGRQYEDIEAMLDRLGTTHVKVVRNIKGRKGESANREVTGDHFIGNYRTISDAVTGRVSMVEFEIAKWIYEEVAVMKSPSVLTVHPSYFLIESGIGRFVYRLARRAAGRTMATYKFRTLFERSNSVGTFKEFCRMLRSGIIANNDLPEYRVEEVQGQDGPMLLMTHRDYVVPLGGPAVSEGESIVQ